MSGEAPVERRYLPPGTVGALWRDFCAQRPEKSVARATFHRVFQTQFSKKLGFRRWALMGDVLAVFFWKNINLALV